MMKKLFFIQLVCVVVSAILLWSSFLPCNEPINIIIALVPLLLIVRRNKPGKAAIWCFACGLIFWVATLSWMPAVIKNNGPWPLVFLGWGALSAFCAGYFALFGYLDACLWQKTEHKSVKRLGALLGEGVLWGGTEWLRATLFTGFAWNTLGTALGSLPSFATPARLGGTYLLSMLIVLLNGVFATLGERLLDSMQQQEEAPSKTDRLLKALETALPLALILIFQQISTPQREAQEGTVLRIALIQRNAPCRFDRQTRLDPLRSFGDLMENTSAAHADLAVWAESAMAEFGPVRSTNARAIAQHMLRKGKAGALLAGGNDIETMPDATRREYNAVALYEVDTNEEVQVSIYQKQHLVPFGEYIPFDKIITPLQQLSPVGVSIYPGKPVLFDITPRTETERAEKTNERPVKIAPLICFEDTDETLARKAASLGAEAIVLVTNDSWFSKSHEAECHAAHAIMRAIETGLPIIRTGNSGVTGIITPTGRTRWLTDGTGRVLTDHAGVMTESVPIIYHPTRTPYVRWGNTPLLGCALLAAIIALYRRFKRLPTHRA